MVDKRGHENGGEDGGSTAKRPRAEGEPLATEAAAVAKKPSISLDALAKAKKALQLQKELKEKLKNMPQLQKPVAGAPAPAAGAPGNPLLAAATAKAAQIAASFGLPVALPTQTPAAATAAAAAMGMAAAATAFGTVRPPLPAPGFRAAPLRLDAQGREVDEKGNVIARPVQVVSSLKVNQGLTQERRPAGMTGTAPIPGIASTIPGIVSVNPFMKLTPSAPSATELEADPGYDPRMGAPGLKKMDRRRKATFDFVQEGAFQKQAELMRLKARFGDAAVKRPLLPKGPIGPGANPNMVPIGGDANMVPIGIRREVSPALGEVVVGQDGEATPAEPPPPEVEWWDRNLLASGSYEADVSEAGAAVKENKLTIYVEHPVPIEPPAEQAPPPPQPLKLTKKELKKLRTQRRVAKEKEKQDLIRQGLLEPPKPKVRIANLYQVLGEQAVADPTAMEKLTRKEMAERQAAHDDRNLARKLLPEEKREKKLKKLFDDSGVDVITTVYKLARLDNKQHRFKVDINAKENHMTGVILISDDFSLVIVEGCPKSTKRYMKLMLRRIDWTEELENDADDDGAGMDEDDKKDPNTCDMVWQGIVKQRAFKNFRTETIPDAALAKALLESHNIGNYWDIAAAYNRDEAPAIVLD